MNLVLHPLHTFDIIPITEDDLKNYQLISLPLNGIPDIFFFFYPHLKPFFHCFQRERKGGMEGGKGWGEREAGRVRERETSIGCLLGYACRRPGIKPVTLCPKHLSHASQGGISYILKDTLYISPCFSGKHT